MWHEQSVKKFAKALCRQNQPQSNVIIVMPPAKTNNREESQNEKTPD
jgi:hypothetical protein